MQIPLMGTTIKAGADFSLQGGCDGCELVGNFLLQINPFLSGLGLPLCLLGCAGAIIGFTKAIPDSLGPPPNPSKLISATAAIAKKCACVLAVALPPPVGLICDFLKMVSDIVTFLSQVVTCLTGLVTHLASFSLKASILLASPNETMQATGSCLVDQGQGMMDLLNGKLSGLAVLLALLEPVFDLLALVVPPPFNDTIVQLKDGFATFQAATPVGTPPGDFLAALQTFSTTLQSVATTFSSIVSICP
jgi:hypothetical protein